MIENIFISFLLQIVFTVGLIFLFGFAVSLCNKRFYANFGDYGKLVCYVTGAVGTPLHECAHALFCVLFGHKVTAVKLFQIDSADGTLGYVNHSYNPKNIYQRIGNFFIGIAPITVISAVLYLLAWLLLPEWTAGIKIVIDFTGGVAAFGAACGDIFSAVPIFFTYAGTWQWWALVVAGITLALHMTLSKADIKGALGGLIFLLIVMLAVDVTLGLIDGALLLKFTAGVLTAAGYLLNVFLLALVIDLIAVAVSFAFRAAKLRRR